MKIFLFAILLLVSSIASATHLKSGEITITYIDGATYRITLTVYVRYIGQGSVLFSQDGAGTLDFGDGSAAHHPPTQEGRPLNANLRVVEYSITHTYTSGIYSVSYTEPNYSEGILNFFNSVSTPFTMRAAVNAGAAHPYTSPKFFGATALRFPAHHEMLYSAASTSASPLSYYSLVVPPNVIDFSYPEDLQINPYNGLMTWNGAFRSRFSVGEFLFCVRVSSFDADEVFLGYTDRLISVILEDDISQIFANSEGTGENARVVVTQDQTKTIKFLLRDKNMDSLRWTLDRDSLLLENVTLTEYDSAADDENFRIGLLSLHTTASIVRDDHYVISLRGSSYSNTGLYQRRADANVLFFTKDVPIHEIPGQDITGVAENTPEISAYPVPCHAWIHLDGVRTGAQLTFRNVQGQNALEVQKEQNLPVNISALPVGFYILEVNDGVRRSRMKIICE